MTKRGWACGGACDRGDLDARLDLGLSSYSQTFGKTAVSSHAIRLSWLFT